MRHFRKKLMDDGNPSPRQPEHDSGGDYAVKTKKSIYIAARILAVLGAILLWIYVASTNNATEEQDFSLVPITYREESVLKNEYGLIVQTINIDTLNVKLMGNRTDVRALSASDVKAYVNLGSIDKAGEYELAVYVDVPSGTTCVSQTVDKVVVSVDKPASKTLPLSPDKVVLSGWSLAKDCFFGDISLNADAIVLEGPTLELEKVEDVAVKTDVIGSANAGFTTTASVHLIDPDGNEIVGSNVSVRGVGDLRVSVEVLKTIEVKLVLEGKDGKLTDEQARLTPSSVLLTGSPEALDGRKELVVGKIDETALTVDTEKQYSLSLEGIEITDASGNAVASVTAAVTAPEQIVPTPKTFTLTNLPVLKNGVAIGRVSMSVTAENDEDAAILKLLTVDNITVILPANESSISLDKMIVSFDKPYLTAISDYTLLTYKGGA